MSTVTSVGIMRCWLGKLVRPLLVRVFGAKRVHLWDVIFTYGYMETYSKRKAYLYLWRNRGIKTYTQFINNRI